MAIIDANIICDISTLSREEWLAVREHGCLTPNDPNSKGWIPYTITGSMASCVMNANPWMTGLEYFNQKIGRNAVKEREMNEEILRAGNEAEEFVARQFARKIREDFPDLKEIEIVNDTNMYQHKEYSFMLADLDRLAIITLASGKKIIAGLECKTTRSQKTKELFKNGIVPVNYEWQCRHYMAVTNINAWYICACWGFTIDECEVILVKRDKEIEQTLINAEKYFVECCEKGITPKFDKGDSVLLNQYYNRLYGGLPEGEDGKIELSESPETRGIFNAAENLNSLYEKKKEIEAQINLEEANIVADLISLTDGKKSYFELRKNNEEVQAIALKVPYKRDSVDIDKIKAENEELYKECQLIGAKKVTKTELGKIKINGAKVNATPYIIPGEVNMDAPIEFGGLKTFTKLA